MTSRPVKKHHHTAPKVYLRGFADANHQVTVRRRSGDERDLHISNVTVRNGFYNATGSDGVLHDTAPDRQRGGRMAHIRAADSYHPAESLDVTWCKGAG